MTSANNSSCRFSVGRHFGLNNLAHEKKELQEEMAGKFAAPVPTSSTLLRIVN